MTDPLAVLPDRLRARPGDLPAVAWVAARAFGIGSGAVRVLVAAGVWPVWLLVLGYHLAGGELFTHRRRALIVLARREPLRRGLRRRRPAVLGTVLACVAAPGVLVLATVVWLALALTGSPAAGLLAAVVLAIWATLPILVQVPFLLRSRQDRSQAQRAGRLPDGERVLSAAAAAAWPPGRGHFSALAGPLRAAAERGGVQVVAIARTPALAEAYQRCWQLRRLDPDSLIVVGPVSVG
jgi:hypothetical protein